MVDHAPAPRNVPGPPQLIVQGPLRTSREHFPLFRGLLACVRVSSLVPAGESQPQPGPCTRASPGAAVLREKRRGDASPALCAVTLGFTTNRSVAQRRGTTGETAQTRSVPQSCRKQSEATAGGRLVAEPWQSCCGTISQGFLRPPCVGSTGRAERPGFPRECTFVTHKEVTRSHGAGQVAAH